MNSLIKSLKIFFKPLTDRFGIWPIASAGVALVVIIVLAPSLSRTVIDYSVPISELSRRASLAQQEGDTKTALRLYRTISARASKTDFSSNYELGNIYFDMENYDLAEKYYLKAASNPAAPLSVFYRLSDLYLNYLPNKQSNFTNFVANKIQRERAEDAGLAVVLAAFYQETGDNASALQWYERALQLEPDNTAVQNAINELRS